MAECIFFGTVCSIKVYVVLVTEIPFYTITFLHKMSLYLNMGEKTFNIENLDQMKEYQNGNAM